MKLPLKALPLILFVACASSPATDKGYLTSEDFIGSGNWKTQGDPDSYASHLSIIVAVTDDNKKITESLSAWLEAELGRVKRFKTYIQYNDGAVRLASDLGRLGVVKAQEQVLPELGLALNIALKTSRERKEAPSGNDNEWFYVDISYMLAEIIDGRREELKSGTLFGRTPREVVMGPNGRVGGWVENDASIAAAFREATVGPLRELVSMLGIEFPVVAGVVSVTGTRIAIDKGSENGIPKMADNNFILCLDDNGITIPIMKAVSDSTQNRRSTLTIVKFNSFDEDALPHVKSFRNDPESWLNQYRSKIYAVSIGLGLTEEWADMDSQKSGRVK